MWPGGISAGNEQTVISDITWDVARAREACTVVSVTGIDATPRNWEILVDLSTAPWYGTSADQLVLSGSGKLTVLDDMTVSITGRSNPGKFNSRTNNTPITNTQTALLEICNHQAPEPLPGDASWYTVERTPATWTDATPATWTDTRACIVVTVTTARDDLESFPFYFGWAADVDLSGAMAHLAGHEPLSITFEPRANGANDYSVTPLEAEFNYMITSGYDSALRARGGGADSFSTTVCVNGS